MRFERRAAQYRLSGRLAEMQLSKGDEYPKILLDQGKATSEDGQKLDLYRVWWKPDKEYCFALHSDKFKEIRRIAKGTKKKPGSMLGAANAIKQRSRGRYNCETGEFMFKEPKPPKKKRVAAKKAAKALSKISHRLQSGKQSTLFDESVSALEYIRTELRESPLFRRRGMTEDVIAPEDERYDDILFEIGRMRGWLMPDGEFISIGNPTGVGSRTSHAYNAYKIISGGQEPPPEIARDWMKLLVWEQALLHRVGAVRFATGIMFNFSSKHRGALKRAKRFIFDRIPDLADLDPDAVIVRIDVATPEGEVQDYALDVDELPDFDPFRGGGSGGSHGYQGDPMLRDLWVRKAAAESVTEGSGSPASVSGWILPDGEWISSDVDNHAGIVADRLGLDYDPVPWDDPEYNESDDADLRDDMYQHGYDAGWLRISGGNIDLDQVKGGVTRAQWNKLAEIAMEHPKQDEVFVFWIGGSYADRVKVAAKDLAVTNKPEDVITIFDKAQAARNRRTKESVTEGALTETSLWGWIVGGVYDEIPHTGGSHHARYVRDAVGEEYDDFSNDQEAIDWALENGWVRVGFEGIQVSSFNKTVLGEVQDMLLNYLKGVSPEYRESILHRPYHVDVTNMAGSQSYTTTIDEILTAKRPSQITSRRNLDKARRYYTNESVTEDDAGGFSKSWYNVRTGENVELEYSAHHADDVFDNPERYGLTSEELEQYRKEDDHPWNLELFERMAQDGWVRIITIGGGVLGTDLNMSGGNRRDLKKALDYVASRMKIDRVIAEWPGGKASGPMQAMLDQGIRPGMYEDTDRDAEADAMLSRYEEEPTNIWLYTDMPVKDRVAWAYLAADGFKGSEGEDLVARFTNTLRTVVDDPDTFWEQIREKDPERARYLDSLEWGIDMVPLDEIGVYPRFSGFSDEVCSGDVAETAYEAVESGEQPDKVAKLEQMSEVWQTIMKFLPPILVPGEILRGRKKDYEQTKYACDDGNHRLVAAAMAGAREAVCFVGKPKGGDDEAE